MIDIDIFKQGWESNETPCGWGSELGHTIEIRQNLPELIKQFNIKTINDAGCGDFNWIKQVDLSGIDYIGYDIVKRNSWDNVKYKHEILDISSNVMRKCDLIICRDVFIHLPNSIINQILLLFKKSGNLLLSTVYDDVISNFDRPTSTSKKYAKLNLSLSPFNLQKLKFTIKEDYPNKYSQLYHL